MNKATALQIVRQCCDSVACDKPTRDKIEAALAWLDQATEQKPTTTKTQKPTTS